MNVTDLPTKLRVQVDGRGHIHRSCKVCARDRKRAAA